MAPAGVEERPGTDSPGGWPAPGALDTVDHDVNQPHMTLERPPSSPEDLPPPDLIVPDLAVERSVTALRRTLALAWRAGAGHADLGDPRRLSGLARHIFLTGYVHPLSPEEEEVVPGLASAARVVLEREMASESESDSGPVPEGSHPNPVVPILLLACYRSLGEMEGLAGPLTRWAAGRRESDPLVEVVHQQILAPLQEEALRGGIPRLDPTRTLPDGGTLPDDRVRTHYERWPYPRWARAPQVDPVPLSGFLARRFPGRSFPGLDGVEAPRALVAGCGTGLHPVTLASELAGSRVTGLDVSLSSLAYAVRMVRELGVEGVTFVQGDLRDLPGWEEEVHLVESVGVLQHLEDPVEGWEALLSPLVPGGLLELGLYSRRAREGLPALRRLLGDPDPEVADGEVRRLRQEVIRLTPHHPEAREVLRWRDFWTLPGFRDLLLHPLEREFDLPELSGIIDALGLEFLGFEGLPREVLEAFRRAHPGATVTDLDAWARFEEAHPHTFRDLYRFWIRRR